MSVDILLATYQGKNFIVEQIDSILNQTFSDFTLIIRDDGSTDGTYEILQQIAQREKRIILLPQADKSILLNQSRASGATHNFLQLMHQSKADIIFFADQDDLWHPEKVLVMAEALKKLAEEEERDTPLLLHCDLEVVDENNQLLHPSFWGLNQFHPSESNQFSHLLIQNCVTGCAMVMNRSLLKKGLEMPLEAIQHDWWLALIASSMGKLESIKQPLVRYRQHANNVLGAKKHSLWMHPVKLIKKFKAKRYEANLKQAQAFFNVFHKILPYTPLNTLKAYLSLPHLGYISSRKVIFKNKLFKQGGLRRVIHFFLSYK